MEDTGVGLPWNGGIEQLTEETPECLNIGPALRFYDDLEHEKERQAELDHFEYACKNCYFEDGCKWARQFYFDEEEEL